MLILLGLLLTVLSGVIQGVFLAPLDRPRAWPWEHTWAVWSVVAMLLGPIAMALVSIPHPVQWLQRSGIPVVGMALCIGFLAGTSGVALAYGVARLGVAVAVGINAGISTIVGALAPLASRSITSTPDSIVTLLIGVGLCVMGTCCSALAAKHRDEHEHEHVLAARPRFSWFAAVVAIYSGISSSAFNVGIAFPGQLAAAARSTGAGGFGEAYAFLAPYMIGGFLFNFSFALAKVSRRRSWGLFRRAQSLQEGTLAVVMGLAFSISISLYTASESMLGVGWTQAGWAALTSSTILAAGIWDFRHKRWAGRARRYLTLAIALSIASLPVLLASEWLRTR